MMLGFHKLEIGKQEQEVSEVRMTPCSLMTMQKPNVAWLIYFLRDGVILCGMRDAKAAAKLWA
jgi:hypothetical protein